jgi:hypothetical protein
MLEDKRLTDWRYRQGRDLADKATRRRIRRWGLNPESVGECPHLSGARGVSRALAFRNLPYARLKTEHKAWV